MRPICFALGCLLLAIALFAQAPTGIISGTVTDATGAVVPSAVITIANTATSAVRTISANAEGLYSAPALQPGDYDVRVTMAGFRTVVRPALVVAGSTTTVDVTLTLGEEKEIVTVEAATAQINYDNSTVQGIIARQNIQDLPLNGRSSLQLASLEPGVTVVAGAPSQFNAVFNVQVLGGGGLSGTSGVGPITTMDGGTINDEVEGGTSMNFSQEIVQEFQLASVNFDLSTGIAASGGVNIVTRSGSNDFHGSAYFFFRDHNLAAYPGLRRSTLSPDPFFARRNPGFWLGGPIKRDKLFFFFNYEYMNQTTVFVDQQDLPSLQPVNGVFPSPYRSKLITTRFDYHLSDKHTLFARYSHDGNHDFGPYSTISMPAAWNYNDNWSDQSIMGVTSTLTPSIVNDIRFQYHFWQNKAPDANPSDCVFPCIGFGLPTVFSMLGSSTFLSGNSYNSPQFHQSRSYQVNETLSWQKGTHRFRFGFDVEHMRTAYKPWNPCQPACLYVASPEFIKGLGPAITQNFPTLPTTISSTADLLNLPLYGLPSSVYSGVGVGNGSFPGAYENDSGGTNNRLHPWFGDTWKIRPDFTLNYGIAYDLETGLFNGNMPRPQFLAPILNSQTGGLPPGLAATSSNKADFAPQFGFAWAVGKDRKTVIRGGGGIYWDTQPLWEKFKEDAVVGPLGDGRQTLAVSAFQNVFPNIFVAGASAPLAIGAPIPLNAVTSLTLGQFIQIMNQQLPNIQQQLFPAPPRSGPYSVSGIDVAKQGIEIYPSNFPLLRSYQTSVGFQRDLGHDMVLTLDWARRQGENVNLGELDLNRSGRRNAAGQLSPVIPACTASQLFVVGQECSTGSITFWVPEGRSVYDGMLLKVQKRLTHSFQFTASYAFQKNLGERATVNLDNYFAGYGPTLPRHNLNLSGVVNFPWGFVISVNSSIVASTPVTPTISGIDLNGAGNTTFPIAEAVPNIGYNCFNQGCGKSDLEKAVAAFNQTWAGKKALNGVTIPQLILPPDYSLGTPIFSQDFRVTKDFRFKERYRFSLFSEFFNAFNVSNLLYSNFTLDTVKAAQTFAFGQPSNRLGQVFGSGGARAIQVGGRFTF